MDLSRAQLKNDQTGYFCPVHYYIDHMKFIKKRNIVLYTLLIQGLQDHVTGPVRGVARPVDRGFSIISSVPAEFSLIDFALRRPAERQPPVLKIINRLNSLFGKNYSCLLVNKIVPALNGVKSVPIRFIFIHIPECCTDPEVPVTVNDAVPTGVSGSVVVTVSVEVAPLAPGETVLGTKTHTVCAGRPEHESATSPAKVPPSGSTVTV